jgi:hypothetical protein
MPRAAAPVETLLVVHYHWRRGGVRTVVERTLPAIMAAAPPGLERVVLLSGDAASGGPAVEGVHLQHEEAVDYFEAGSGQPEAASKAIRQALQRVGDPVGLLVWMHNPGIARNIPLNREVARLADEGAGVVFHHHDFWCAHRWSRWSGMRACGIDSLAQAAGVVLPARRGIVHAVINRADHDALVPSFGRRVGHLPNPIAVATPHAPSSREWVERRFGGKRFWLAPTRFLRRKNLLEAMLLASWIDPGAVFATGSAAFSPGEAAYAERVRAAASGVPVDCDFGILDGGHAPAMASLMPQASGVLLTSLQEGFGMAFIESATAGVPLVSRRLPEVDGDLRAVGYTPANSYGEVWVPWDVVDRRAELDRRASLLGRLRAMLPPEIAGMLREPPDDGSGLVAFGRLTLEGQCTALTRATWRECARWNPELAAIRDMLGKGSLPVAAVPDVEDRYAEKFWEMATMARESGSGPAGASLAAQTALARRALAADSFFPLLWE